MKLIILISMLFIACSTGRKNSAMHKTAIISTGYPHPIVNRAVGTFVKDTTTKQQESIMVLPDTTTVSTNYSSGYGCILRASGRFITVPDSLIDKRKSESILKRLKRLGCKHYQY